jgi:hypothetical protein
MNAARRKTTDADSGDGYITVGGYVSDRYARNIWFEVIADRSL